MGAISCTSVGLEHWGFLGFVNKGCLYLCDMSGRGCGAMFGWGYGISGDPAGLVSINGLPKPSSVVCGDMSWSGCTPGFLFVINCLQSSLWVLVKKPIFLWLFASLALVGDSLGLSTP